MLIRNVQVGHNFSTILLYNFALLYGQPKLKPGKYAISLTCPADNSEKKSIWIPATKCQRHTTVLTTKFSRFWGVSGEQK